MKRYLRMNRVLESLIEFFIMQHLRAENPHLDEELTYDHQIVIHSVELVEDDFMIANVEHSLYDVERGSYLRPSFSKVELTPVWPPETVFNIAVAE